MSPQKESPKMSPQKMIGPTIRPFGKPPVFVEANDPKRDVQPARTSFARAHRGDDPTFGVLNVQQQQTSTKDEKLKGKTSEKKNEKNLRCIKWW